MASMQENIFFSLFFFFFFFVLHTEKDHTQTIYSIFVFKILWF